jgi:hypothetical protein
VEIAAQPSLIAASARGRFKKKSSLKSRYFGRFAVVCALEGIMSDAGGSFSGDDDELVEVRVLLLKREPSFASKAFH